MNDRRPTVIQFGAGAIGRGFLGQLWTEGGYEVVFVDVDAALVAALNASGSYPLRLIGTGSEEKLSVGPVRALLATDVEAVRRAVSDCAFAATAVGLRHLADIGYRLLAPGVARRAAGGLPPLNVFCCENGASAPGILAAGIRASLPDPARADAFAVVETVVGRMVPPPGEDDAAAVTAEPYKRLPFRAADWHGPLPEVPGLVPVYTPAAWHLEEQRKLFTHNGGHAVLAYLGARGGYTYIWEAAGDRGVSDALRGFWAEVDAALAADPESAAVYDLHDQERFEADLLERFRNRALGDTVARVGRDPGRKLHPDDRLVGAALLCLSRGVVPVHAARAVAAALRFDASADPSAADVRSAVSEGGVAGALQRLAGIPADHPLSRLVAEAYEAGGD